MKISGWGRFPVVDAEQHAPTTRTQLAEALSIQAGFAGIARGMGRSYGDCSLAPRTLSCLHLDHLLGFDPQTGVLRCGAGATLADLLEVFVPRGWFPAVTPGTRYVTVGGCIASDVHGKNHHLDGSFCDHVESLRLMLAGGEVVTCSASENPELFHATCGGMGLTGVIVEACIRMVRVPGARVEQRVYRASDLDEVLAQFQSHAGARYSVAWLDGLASGRNLGRSVLSVGDHAAGDGVAPDRPRLTVPVDLPRFVLNRGTVGAFNRWYYRRAAGSGDSRRVPYGAFFYPLDGIGHWNRLYGRSGFSQYQFVLPMETGRDGMVAVLEEVVRSGRVAMLAVLKVFGKENRNMLSFPMEGLTLSLDFRVEPGLGAFLRRLDALVHDRGGRVYLTKDAHLGEADFKRGYPRWEAFAQARARHGADRMFVSLQSQRLGLAA